MQLLPQILSHLETLGVANVHYQYGDAVLQAETSLVRLVVTEESGPTPAICIELQIVPKVQHNRLALWHVINQNHAAVPFGQFFISPANAVCLGVLLPEHHPYVNWLPRLLFELLDAAEGAYKTLHTDLDELPAHEMHLRPNLVHLVRSNLTPPERQREMSRELAAELVLRLLVEQLGQGSVAEVAKYAYALTVAGSLITLTFTDMPFAQGQKHTGLQKPWCLALRTEVCVLEQADAKLWVMLNRMNRDACGQALAVRYNNGSRPVLVQHTHLPADALVHPTFVLQVLQLHAARAEALHAELKTAYSVQSPMAYKLGLR